ncbi:hypothetical protein QFC19_000005 [Naganishia cerealis]|uniref:Uncharacterized protein n=1 Tax=Naganishia cerealis TaxID=610337 RepID=A0ACC2WQ88_9TREE|nr:hypothetical protein QFC19_000005 [Naganishia cerealis]
MEGDSSVEFGRNAMAKHRVTVGRKALQESIAPNWIEPDTTLDDAGRDGTDEDWEATRTPKKVTGKQKNKIVNAVTRPGKKSQATRADKHSTSTKCRSTANPEFIRDEAPDLSSASPFEESTSTSPRDSIHSRQLSPDSMSSAILLDVDSSFRPQRRAASQKKLRSRVVSSSEVSTTGEDHDAGIIGEDREWPLNAHQQEEEEILASLDKLSFASAQKRTHLDDALQLCNQSEPHDFATFINTYRSSSISNTGEVKRGASVSSGDKRTNCFEKLGEASYSEVFGVWSASSSPPDKTPKMVMKVVPLALQLSELPSSQSSGSRVPSEDDELCLTEMQDIVKEIELTRLMNEIHDGFVQLREAHIVRGVYPEVLLECWDVYRERKGSDNTRPDCLPQEQYYAILFLDNAGIDLESYRFDKTCGWRQAVDVLWQVADALNAAEEKAEFEDPIWSAIPEEVFDGHGEQWDVYRAMKSHIDAAGGKWEEFYPRTNLMWLYYLTRRLLYATPSLVKPRSKVLSRVISKRDPTRSPIRRRTTRNASATLNTPLTHVNLESGAELEAWQRLRKFEEGMKTGLALPTDIPTRASRSTIPGKSRTQKLKASGNGDQTITSVREALLWFVANE